MKMATTPEQQKIAVDMSPLLGALKTAMAGLHARLYGPVRKPGNGTLRRFKRERLKAEALAALYAATPDSTTESRQVRRRRELLKAKAA